MRLPQLIETLSDLIRINSINPEYPKGRPETEIQRYVLGFFRRHGIDAWEQEVLPERANVIGRLAGRLPGRRFIFEAHSDTAGIDGMTREPFRPELSGGRLYGRGACDTKAGLAAMMHALVDIKSAGPAPAAEIWVAATVDEEHAYRGVLKLRASTQAAGAIVAEPTELRLVIASKGCLRWRTVVKGRAAHSSRPELGVNAITGMARVVMALEEHAGELHRISHPLVGTPTLTIGVIQGGTQVNIVPDQCSIEIDRRLIPGEDPETVYQSYRDSIWKLSAELPALDTSVEPPSVQDWPLETRPDCMLVELASDVLRSYELEGTPVGVPFGSNASKFAQVNVPSIIFGPGSIDQAHTADEYVEVEQVEKAFVFYRDLMRRVE
jgi:succinyl-diaminopimelate desuccinylase